MALPKFSKVALRPNNHVGLRNSFRNDLIAAMAEFIGTFLFLFLSFAGTQAAKNANPNAGGEVAGIFFIAASFGCAVAVNVWIFYRVSGGMLNPAITLGLLLVGAIKPLRAVLIVIAQFIGGIAAAGLTAGLLPGPLAVSNSLGNNVSIVQGLFLEVFLTAQLVLTVYMLAVEKHRSTHLAALGIGIALFMCHMVGVSLTGTSVNPARSLGPAVVEASFVGYHWIYYVGPGVGTLLAFAVYKLLLVSHYELVNPGQDADGLQRESPKNNNIMSEEENIGMGRK